MNKFCYKCGSPLQEGFQFCEKCGAPIEPIEEKTETVIQTPPVQPNNIPYTSERPAQTTDQPKPVKKSKKGLVIGIICAAVVAAAALAVFLVPGILTPVKPASSTETALLPLSSDLVYEEGKAAVHCTYDAPNTIIPAIYRSMDYIVFLKCWSDNGNADLMVSVEIPGFTQKYEQKVSVTRAETQLKIIPPIAEGAVKNLNSSKDAQLVVTVKNIGSGEVIIQDSKPIKLYSRYDMQWASKDGIPYYENFLAWVTPEAPEVKKLVRDSADALSELTQGRYTSIVGYQDMGLSEFDRTYYQVASMMYAMAKYYQVKYVATPFSSTSTELQRCATPTEVLTNHSGLCCETAATLASAIQSTNMHAVLILLPGHMQTAVETAKGSGDYILFETTALDQAAAGMLAINGPVVKELSKKQWSQYVKQDGCEVLDCDLAEALQIKSID